MAFFSEFPSIAYGDTAMKDLSIRVVFRDAIKNNSDLYFLYNVQDGQLPEHIAFNHYGDSNLHWLILYMNDIIDPFYDWVLSRSEIKRYVENKYGVPTLIGGEYQGDGFNKIRHYEKDGVFYYNASDELYYPAPIDAIPITFLEYEEQLNDSKRTIKILYPEYASKIQRELRYIIDDGY